MKRRAPLRRSPLESRSYKNTSEPGRREFKALSMGRCGVCGTRGLVRRHHVVTERAIRAVGMNPWDLRVGLWVGVWCCRCHPAHHTRSRPIPLARLSPENVAFAVECFGEHQAAAYLQRYYSG